MWLKELLGPLVCAGLALVLISCGTSSTPKKKDNDKQVQNDAAGKDKIGATDKDNGDSKDKDKADTKDKADGKDKPAANELARFQGDWLIYKSINRGKNFPAKDAKAIIKATNIKLYQGSEVLEAYDFRIIPAKKPTAIDLIKNGETIPGIYSFEGDLLTITTFASKQKGRPQGSEPKIKLNILILKSHKK